jgi:hypothetical protein
LRRVGLPLLALALVVPAVAGAHAFAPAVLDLREREAGVFAVRWRLTGPVTTAVPDDLAPEWPAHCRPQTVSVHPGESVWEIDCRPRGIDGTSVSVRGLEAHPIDVLVRLTRRDGVTESGILHAGAPRLTVARAASRNRPASGRRLDVAAQYLRLGVEHILFGVDHLLFVTGLLLLVGLRLRALGATITAFTLAHSLTLGVAAAGLVRLPPAPVEALIAVSIAVLAAELARGAEARPTLARRAPWVVAFTFGLLHGLGFAGALAEVGVPAAHFAPALFAFNLGVEIGQMLFVAAMLAPIGVALHLGRRVPLGRLVPAYGLGILAAAWTLERLQAVWM